MAKTATKSKPLSAKKSASLASSKAVKVRARRRVNARYDAAQDTTEFRKHWAMADGYSADASANAGVRQKLRNRARYEIANNSYARGIVETLANDLIGTVPHLQILTDDSEVNSSIEAEFELWARRIRLGEKLRTVKKAKIQDGEAFLILFTNPKVPGRIKLDVGLIEADRVTGGILPTDNDVDGIEFDQYGNPVRYTVLKYHPGDARGGMNDSEKIDAANIIHWFRKDRPNQHRGIPEITPALPLFAQLRRYTLAVIAAAETAADFAAVIYSKTNAQTDDDEGDGADAFNPFETVELEKRMATVLPEGYELGQIKAEQPTTTYGDFKSEIINEFARCVNMPFNIAACNSSKYNYASGRMDHQTYHKSIAVERNDLTDVVLDRIGQAFLDEIILQTEYQRLRNQYIKRQWMFDGQEHVDPSKEANAQDIQLKNGSTNHKREFGKRGLDWQDEIRQQYAEIAFKKKLMADLQLTDADVNPQSTATAKPKPAEKDDDDDAEE